MKRNIFDIKKAQMDAGQPVPTQPLAAPEQPQQTALVCRRCRLPKEDVWKRYSFGVYAGKMCDECAYVSYRDHCGLVKNPDGSYSDRGQQGNPADLDEPLDPDY